MNHPNGGKYFLINEEQAQQLRQIMQVQQAIRAQQQAAQMHQAIQPPPMLQNPFAGNPLFNQMAANAMNNQESPFFVGPDGRRYCRESFPGSPNEWELFLNNVGLASVPPSAVAMKLPGLAGLLNARNSVPLMHQQNMRRPIAPARPPRPAQLPALAPAPAPAPVAQPQVPIAPAPVQNVASTSNAASSSNSIASLNLPSTSQAALNVPVPIETPPNPIAKRPVGRPKAKPVKRQTNVPYRLTPKEAPIRKDPVIARDGKVYRNTYVKCQTTGEVKMISGEEFCQNVELMKCGIVRPLPYFVSSLRCTLTPDIIDEIFKRETNRWRVYLHRIIVDFDLQKTTYNSGKARSVCQKPDMSTLDEIERKAMTRKMNNEKSLQSRHKQRVARASDGFTVVYLRRRVQQYEVRLQKLLDAVLPKEKFLFKNDLPQE